MHRRRTFRMVPALLATAVALVASVVAVQSPAAADSEALLAATGAALADPIRLVDASNQAGVYDFILPVVGVVEHAPSVSTLYAAPATAGSGDCSSWADVCTLQTALASAVSGDEIWVKAGVHQPGTAQSHTYTLKSGVAVYGGFAGTETLLSQRNAAVHVTILSGDIDNNDINTDGNFIAETTADIQGLNSLHVVTGGGTDSTARLDGFTITAGDASGYDGGGVYNLSGSPTLANLTFSGNEANNGGGMFNNTNSSPTLTNVTFSGNASTVSGGGIKNAAGSNPTLTNVTFSGNSSLGYSGGGMHNDNSSPSLTNVTYSNNTADDHGGGMSSINSSSPTLTNVTFSGNASGASGGGMYVNSGNPTLTNVAFSNNTSAFGGGMRIWHGTASLTDVTFSNNTASGNASSTGGGLYTLSSSPTLTRVTFSNNTASVSGGGLGVNGGSPTLINVTLRGNTASGVGLNGGGGIHNNGGALTLTNVTLNANSATSLGGGIYTGGDAITLKNIILWGNTAGNSSYNQMYNASGAPNNATISYSDIQGSGAPGSWNNALGTNGGGNIDADPLFLDSDLRLGFGSPAIETGTNTGCPSTDLDNLPRPADGDGDSIATCDMGAYEGGTMLCSLSTGSYAFPDQSSVAVDITALANLGCVYVDEIETDHPAATGAPDVLSTFTGRYWLMRGLQSDRVTEASGYTVNVTLPHDNLDSPQVCRYASSAWTCAVDSSTATTVTRNGVVAFSDWAVGADAIPTAVTLADFSAVQQGDAVLLTWETVSELTNRGFNLYRGVSPAGPDRQLNTTLIPSQSPGNSSGFIYTWEDRAELIPGTAYFYWVEDVDMRGVATMHGPVSVVFSVPTSLTLAEVGASPAAGSPLSLTGAMLALLALFGAAGRARAARRTSFNPAPRRVGPTGGARPGLSAQPLVGHLA